MSARALRKLMQCHRKLDAKETGISLLKRLGESLQPTLLGSLQFLGGCFSARFSSVVCVNWTDSFIHSMLLSLCILYFTLFKWEEGKENDSFQILWCLWKQLSVVKALRPDHIGDIIRVMPNGWRRLFADTCMIMCLRLTQVWYREMTGIE